MEEIRRIEGFNIFRSLAHNLLKSNAHCLTMPKKRKALKSKKHDKQTLKQQKEAKRDGKIKKAVRMVSPLQ